MKKRETARERDERIVAECGCRLVRVQFSPEVTPIPGSFPRIESAEVIVPRQFFNNGHSFKDWTEAVALILNRTARKRGKK